MKIAVLGATGMAGSAVVTEASRRRHAVLALSRRPGRSADHDRSSGGVRLTVRALDAADRSGLTEVLVGADALVLAIRLAPGQEHRLAPLTRGVLDAAARTATRVLVIGGAGPLRTPDDARRLVVVDPTYVPPAYRALAGASVDQLRTCRQHAHQDWVYLSPPARLELGERTGRYRRGTDTLLVDGAGDSRISASDLATAVVDELESPGGEQHFTVARLIEGPGSRLRAFGDGAPAGAPRHR